MHGEMNFKDADSRGLSVYIHSGYATDNESLAYLYKSYAFNNNGLETRANSDILARHPELSGKRSCRVPECKRTRPTVRRPGNIRSLPRVSSPDSFNCL